MKGINAVVIIILIILIAIGGFYFYNKNDSTKSPITFPSGGEVFVTGKTYTLKWKNSGSTGSGKASTTQIFLVDQALLNQGASVSISDRIYNVEDTGSYEYTVPTAVADSTYFFVIGTTTSNTFTITSSP